MNRLKVLNYIRYKGCLEAMCSSQRIINLYDKYSGQKATSLSMIAKQLKQENKVVQQAVVECAEYLGIGLANLINLCKPTAIVINTGNFSALTPLIEQAIHEIRLRAFPAPMENLVIEMITINEGNTICGAVFHLCDKLFVVSSSNNITE